MQKTILLFAVLLLYFSCSEDDLSTTNNDAAIRAKFIPADSISRLEDQLASNDSLRNKILDQLDLYDSLDNDGDPTDYTGDIVILNERLDSLSTVEDEVDDIVADFQNGNIRLDFLSAVSSPQTVNYAYTTPLYKLPLNPLDTQTTFLTGFGGKEYSSTFTYQLDTVYKEQAVRLLARQIRLTDFDFDSVKVSCDSLKCTSDEILVTFYF